MLLPDFVISALDKVAYSFGYIFGLIRTGDGIFPISDALYSILVTVVIWQRIYLFKLFIWVKELFWPGGGMLPSVNVVDLRGKHPLSGGKNTLDLRNYRTMKKPRRTMTDIQRPT